MGKDNQAKDRQRTKLERKNGTRAPYDRILIVTEGSKTEPLYLEEIRKFYRLQSANVQVQPGELGTEPSQVVHYAQQLFENGDQQKHIRPKSFDQIYAVFDRDEHLTYFDALKKAASLNGQLRNNENKPVKFSAIASIPCFELWLLLHYEDVQAPLHRNEALQRLKPHINNYTKAMSNTFSITREHLDSASQRAQILANKSTAHVDTEPYTAIVDLVELLIKLHE